MICSMVLLKLHRALEFFIEMNKHKFGELLTKESTSSKTGYEYASSRQYNSVSL